MALGVRVEAVLFGIPEIEALFLEHRVEAADGVQVDDRDSPDVAGFLDRLDVIVDEGTAAVGEILRLLVVGRAEVRQGAVDGRQEDDLLVREMGFQVPEHRIQAAAEGVRVEEQGPVKMVGDDAVVVAGNGVIAVPLPQRDAGIVVVRADEHQDRINALAVLGFQPVRLACDVEGLVATDAVDIGLDAQNIYQVVPIDIVVRFNLSHIRDRIAQHAHAGAVPLGLDFRLRQEADGAEQGNKEEESFHLIRRLLRNS